MAIEKLYSTAEAAEVLGITSVRVRQLCQEGRLGESVGNQWIIGHEELMKFKKKKRKPGRPSSAA